MTDDPLNAPTKQPSHLRIYTAMGTHDMLIETMLLVFVKLVKGDGFLYLEKPTRIIPWHDIRQFEIVDDAQHSGLAVWQPGGMAS